MAKIARKTALPFGSTASAGQIGEFGSLAAGSAATSTDPAVIQSLSQWLSGWYSAVENGNSPAIQDVNGFCFVTMYMICYLMQAGVAEWDSGTTYYVGSVVNSGGILYVSLTDTNLNNAVTSQANWKLYGTGIRTTTTTDSATTADEVLRCNPTGATYTQTLPAVATCPIGKMLRIKNVATDGTALTLKGSGAELIEGNNTITLNSTPVKDSITIISTGAAWEIY